MKVKLTKQDKKAIKSWLLLSASGQSDSCPFIVSYPESCARICKVYYSKKIEGKHVCPCFVYTLKTVIRRAKQMLEEGE